MCTYTYLLLCSSLYWELRSHNRFEIGNCFLLLLRPIYFLSWSYGVTNRLYGYVDLREIGNLYLKISVKSLESTSYNLQVKLLYAKNMIVFEINHRKLVTCSIVLGFFIRLNS